MSQFTFPIFQKRIIIFAGAYGSGKTEVAVNYALQLATHSKQTIFIADLDIVNPYFRTREASVALAAMGVHSIIPHNEQRHADLPIIVPEIKGKLDDGEGIVILDVGGDDLGARVLSSLADSFHTNGYEFLMVLNANRPFTADAAGSSKMMKQIEASSRLKLTGIVSNTHLIEETTVQTVATGLKLAEEVAREKGIPVAFVSAMEEIAIELERKNIKVPIVALSRQMLKPWEERVIRH